MITGVLLHPVPKNVGGWFPRTPSLPPSPFNLFSPPSLRFHRPVRSYQAVPTFFLSPCPFFFTPCIFIWFVVRPGNWKKKKKKRNGTLCIVIFGLLPIASFSSPSCFIDISRLRHSSPRGPLPPPRSRPPKRILSRGVAPRPEIVSDLAILSWANGRLRPKVKKSSRLLSGSAWVGKTGVVPLSGPRSSRKARDRIMCPCTSDIDFFFFFFGFLSKKRIKATTENLVCSH